MKAIGGPITGKLKEHPKNAEIDKFVRGSILRGPSSIDLGWDGFAIERHSLPAGERPEKYSDHHFIVLRDEHPCHGERADENGRFVPYRRRPGAISLFTAGIIREVRNVTGMEIIVGALSPALINEIRDEFDRQPRNALHETLNFQDDSLRKLMSLLITESEAGGPTGRLYSDSLSHALATRYFRVGTGKKPLEESALYPRISPLPARALRRILDRIEESFSSELSLAFLANEAGYSRGHFARMFQKATGMTPHRYVLERRVSYACQLLKRPQVRLIDIAAMCGFSNQAHLTTVFRKLEGITPAAYRSNHK
jgi:AraC family transcriptional regulator